LPDHYLWNQNYLHMFGDMLYYMLHHWLELD
jgi:hypothetical protein